MTRQLSHKILFFLLTIAIFHESTWATALEKYVLDTPTFQGELNWDKEAFGDSNELPGWKEQSFTQKSGDVWRVHFVCDIASANPNNWLRTPFIHREEANRLIIRLDYTIRECSKYPGAVRSCKETFQLLYAEADDDAQGAPDFSEKNYKYLKTIAPNAQNMSSATSKSSSSNIYRTEAELTIKSKGVYFAFRDQGACVSILAIKIVYTLCASQVNNLVVFQKTPTGANVTDLVQRVGYCIDNAESKQTPIAYCQANGNWFVTSDNSCMCKHGFYYSANSSQCLACPQGTYKFETSNNNQCLPCPENSWSPSSAYKYCSCNEGYFRPDPENYNSPCLLMPTEPKNLTVFYMDQSSIKLRWNSIGTYEANSVRYVIQCMKCVEAMPLGSHRAGSKKYSILRSTNCARKMKCENYVQFMPPKEEIYDNQVTLKSLDANTQYFIEIYAQHTQNLFKTKSVDISIRTSKELSEMRVQNASAFLIIENNNVILFWSFRQTLSPAKSFELRYWAKSDAPETTTHVLTIDGLLNSYVISDIDPNQLYLFQMRAQTAIGWGPFTDPYESTRYLNSTEINNNNNNIQTDSITISQMPSTQPPTDSSNAVKISTENSPKTENYGGYLALAIAGSLFFIVGTLALVVLITRRSLFAKRQSALSTGSSSSSDCDSLDFAKRKAQLAYNAFACGTNSSSGGSSPMWPPMNSTKTYIDPHTYEDPTKAVNDFAKELAPSSIIIESVIGGGEFGDVCKGYLKCSTWGQAIVAIKTLKGAATEQNRCDFLTEASIMAQFDDANVVHLEGVVTKSLPLMIVTEYMENGSLDTYLRLNETKLQTQQLVKMLRDVASGMRYLSEMNYIHRDLAARNILVNKDLVCKVADFGLSREIEHDTTDGAYTTKGGKIPIRWTAPEAIIYRKFTCASDVWSFGVLAWEVLSYGERPYWNWSNQDVIKAIEKGYRLPTPQNCPEFMYDMLTKCWHAERTKRPKFVELVFMLDDYQRHPDEIKKLARQREILPINPNQPTYVQLTSTKEFLTQIKLEHYLENFERASLLNLSQLFHLEPRDLMFSVAISNKADHSLIMEALNSISNHFNTYYSSYAIGNSVATTSSTNLMHNEDNQLIPSSQYNNKAFSTSQMHFVKASTQNTVSNVTQGFLV